MDSTIAILEALKAKTGAASDYQLAKILGVSRAAMSTYRVGRGSFSDELAIKVASLLDVEACLIFTIIYAERAKTPELKAVWRSTFERLGGIAASLLIASTLLAEPSTGEASQPALTKDVPSLYIMLNIKIS